jgi:inner membrane protein
MGRQLGWRAAVAGGLIATIPDLDVFVPFGDPVKDFTYHRSASHSLPLLTVFAPLLAWLICRFMAPEKRDYRRWLALTWLALFTHPLIDSATVYGTQLLWPFTQYPFGVGSVFIIDPLYTLPLLFGTTAALMLRQRPTLAARANATGLALSTMYMLMTLVAQSHVLSLARNQVLAQGLDADRVLVTTSPFNTVLWRIVAVGDSDYFVAYHSLYAPQPKLMFRRYPHDEKLLSDVADAWAVQRLRWFTKGIYAATADETGLVMTDLRMGLEPDGYVFSFVVGRRGAGGELSPLDPTEVHHGQPRDLSVLKTIWHRLLTGQEPPQS